MRSDRIFLGMPGYGDVTAGAARGFWRASRRDDEQVIRVYNEGSLLANNFNRLWCLALNARVAYFAMQHADIEPEDWWLDTLIDILESEGLDVVGVPAPIKSHDGLSSLALADPSTDWRVKCRLSMEEILGLPPVFTSTDVGHPLLLNTGLWACKFDPSWASLVHFTINDRIVTSPDGTYHAEVEPEDWYVSRAFHELKLKVAATRRVKLNHRGSCAWPNHVAWGQRWDGAYTDGTCLNPQTRDGFTFPIDVAGWLTYDEGRALFDLATDQNVLEIGAYCGKSTICLAQSARSVVSVDTFDGRGTPTPRDTYAEMRSNVDRYGLQDKVTAIRGTASFLPDHPFDLIFIDGSHDYASVSDDIASSLARLSPDGLLAFHDFDSRNDPGVTKAVHRHLLDCGGSLVSVHDSLAVVRPPAAIPLEV
jgi:hypothetical protein